MANKAIQLAPHVLNIASAAMQAYQGDPAGGLARIAAMPYEAKQRREQEAMADIARKIAEARLGLMHADLAAQPTRLDIAKTEHEQAKTGLERSQAELKEFLASSPTRKTMLQHSLARALIESPPEIAAGVMRDFSPEDSPVGGLRQQLAILAAARERAEQEALQRNLPAYRLIADLRAQKDAAAQAEGLGANKLAGLQLLQRELARLESMPKTVEVSEAIKNVHSAIVDLLKSGVVPPSERKEEQLSPDELKEKIRRKLIERGVRP